MTVFSTSERKREEALKVLKADHFIVSKDDEQMKVRAIYQPVCVCVMQWY